MTFYINIKLNEECSDKISGGIIIIDRKCGLSQTFCAHFKKEIRTKFSRMEEVIYFEIECLIN